MINYTHQYIETNGVKLHTVIVGEEDATPILLLHGFPEFWYGWKKQIDFLADNGYRVIVPDQRGYNLSEKPVGKDAYRIDELAKDIIGLIDALGYEQIYLAGHDWGAIVSWWLVTHFPQRLKKLAILNVPYPSVLGRSYRGNIRQTLRSWYVMYFQIPWLPDRLMSLWNYWGLRTMLKASSRRNTFSEEDMKQYVQAWSQPGAVTATINWYRAGSKALSAPIPKTRSIKVPTLMLWGERDIALGKELAQPSIDLCADGKLVFFPKATHWVAHDEAEAVNQHFLDFFRD